MLYSFGVQNYCNLNMHKPVILQNGLTFIYGPCGSGKTSFCRALGDICDYTAYKNWKTACFYYCFIYAGYTFIYTYERDNKGKVKNADISIPQLQYRYRHIDDMCYPLQIFSICRVLSENKNIHRVLNLFEYYLVNKFHLYDDTEFSASANLCDSSLPPFRFKQMGQICTTGAEHTVIIDDFEYSRCNGDSKPQTLARRMTEEGTQGILAVRRSEWISEKYGGIGHYFFLKSGDLICADQCLKKEIRSLDQIRHLFLKGAFDSEGL